MNDEQEWKQSREREEALKNYDKYCQRHIARGDIKEIPIESYREAFIKREKAIDELSKVTNDVNLREWTIKCFLPAHKNYLRVCGQKPCEAEDCAKILEPATHPRKRYCSEACRQRQKRRRYREKNPEGKE